MAARASHQHTVDLVSIMIMMTLFYRLLLADIKCYYKGVVLCCKTSYICVLFLSRGKTGFQFGLHFAWKKIILLHKFLSRIVCRIKVLIFFFFFFWGGGYLFNFSQHLDNIIKLLYSFY